MVNSLLVWTWAIVFAATSVITVPALINVHGFKLKDEFLNKRFYTLIFEIVVGGVIVFQNTIIHADVNIIRNTSPLLPGSLAKGSLLL